MTSLKHIGTCLLALSLLPLHGPNQRNGERDFDFEIC